MGDNKESLLLKQVYYHENCSGCKIVKRKAECPNIPWLHLFYMWMISLCSALSVSSIFPFLYFMIRDFQIAKQEEDISFYGGFIGSLFMAGRFLTSIHWGIVSDRYGRKPVILISTMAIVVFNAIFGLCTNYWIAIVVRFLLGAFNGVMGPLRAYVVEVCRREHQAIGVSMLGSGWAVGLVIGPAIGGYLALPAEKFPNVFSQESIFGRFPYFLACLMISVFAFFVFIICFWLPETLHSHPVEDVDAEKLQQVEPKTSNSWFSLLKNWPLMSTVIIYSIFMLHDMAYTEVFSLWAVSPRSLGGLSFQTDDVGQALMTSGVGLLLFNTLLYPVFERLLGLLTLSRIAAVLSIGLLSCFPFTTRLSGLTLTLVINFASALQVILACAIANGLFLLQNRVVSQEQRGTASGISLSITSLSNAIGPAFAGSILSWTQRRQNASFLPGSHMVFFLLNLIKFVGLVMTFKPFMVKPPQEFD